MKQDCPNNRIINVFHIEDGQKGLDRMIEFSDYIAISVPELRFLKKKNHTYHLAHYIKNKKPEIDIHLLGCTELKMLKDLSFCSSADSTTWIAAKRFGYIKGKHISTIKSEQVQKLINKKDYQEILQYNKEQNANTTILNTIYLLNQYTKYAGNQK